MITSIEMVETLASGLVEEINAQAIKMAAIEKQRDDLLIAADLFANNWLLDERDDIVFCISVQHHEDIKSLFEAIKKAKESLNEN